MDTEGALAALKLEFGAEWQIEQTVSPGGWVAVKRPTPSSQEIHAARDLAELRGKLEAARG